MSRAADSPAPQVQPFFRCSAFRPTRQRTDSKKAVISALRFVRSRVFRQPHCLRGAFETCCSLPGSPARIRVWTRTLIARANPRLRPTTRQGPVRQRLPPPQPRKRLILCHFGNAVARRSALEHGPDRHGASFSRTVRAKARGRPASRAHTLGPSRSISVSSGGFSTSLAVFRSRWLSSTASRKFFNSPSIMMAGCAAAEASQRSRRFIRYAAATSVAVSLSRRPWIGVRLMQIAFAAQNRCLTSSALPGRVSQTSSCGRGMSPGTAGSSRARRR